MSIKEPFNRPDWRLPAGDLDFIEAAFDLAANDIESRCGVRHTLREIDGENLLIGQHGKPGNLFRITKVDIGYLLGDSEMTARSVPFYVGPLQDDFARTLHSEMIERLDTRDRLAYRNAIVGMPFDTDEKNAYLEKLAGFEQSPDTTSPVQAASVTAPTDELVTLRSRTKTPVTPDWH